MRNDVSVFKLIWDKVRIKAFPYVSSHMLLFLNWRLMQSGKFIDFLEVCKCGMLCVNFFSVAVYRSADMELCHPLSNKE